MNTSKITPAATLTLCLLGALLALTPQAIGQSANGATKRTPFVLSESLPIPTHIIQPRIGERYAGMQVKMTFWVDKSGRPYDAGCNDFGADRNLVSTLSANLALWKFTPAKDADGNPVARRVMLPVTIHAPKDGRETLVAFGPIK